MDEASQGAELAHVLLNLNMPCIQTLVLSTNIIILKFVTGNQRKHEICFLSTGLEWLKYIFSYVVAIAGSRVECNWQHLN